MINMACDQKILRRPNPPRNSTLGDTCRGDEEEKKIGSRSQLREFRWRLALVAETTAGSEIGVRALRCFSPPSRRRDIYSRAPTGNPIPREAVARRADERVFISTAAEPPRCLDTVGRPLHEGEWIAPAQILKHVAARRIVEPQF